MKPVDVQLDLQGARGRGCGVGVVWGLGNKRILLCHQRGSAPNSSPALWRQLFIFWGVMAAGRREGI